MFTLKYSKKTGGRAAAVLAALALASAAGTGGASAAPQRPAPLFPLVGSSADRVTVADEVAAAKYGTTSPIDDPTREKQVIDAMVAKGAALGLDAKTVQTFFRAQIDANKEVQRGLYAYWTAYPDRAPTTRPSLAAIRVVIDRLNTQLLTELAATDVHRTSPLCGLELAADTLLTDVQRHFDRLHATALADSLRATCKH